MGRTRVVDREALLLAAERVVMREGAAHVTLDAVAAEAGISKASVLYDYKTKQALLKAVIERRISLHTGRLKEAMEALIAKGEKADSAIRARLAVSDDVKTGADREVALNLIAAAAKDAALHAPVQDSFRKQIAEIRKTSRNPRAAMLAFLAIEGLNLIEYFGLYAWPKEERRRLFADIESLIDAELAAPSKRHRTQPSRSADR